ncbi:hypothetical protein [Streptomyces canus]
MNRSAYSVWRSGASGWPVKSSSLSALLVWLADNSSVRAVILQTRA